MDSLTQIALGASIGVAVMGRRTAAWKAALWGGVAGLLPDLDVLLDHGDPVLNMVLHRAETHALFWQALASGPLAWLVARITGEPGLWRRWWLAIALALLTHPIDLTEHIGVVNESTKEVHRLHHGLAGRHAHHGRVVRRLQAHQHLGLVHHRKRHQGPRQHVRAHLGPTTTAAHGFGGQGLQRLLAAQGQ